MNFFFNKNLVQYYNNSINYGVNELYIHHNYRIKYYDEYKYIHQLEGRLIKIGRKKNTFFLRFYIKSNSFYIYFLYDSPLLISVQKI